ncbi:uncharacterized protein CEXT_770691 [Caerostris extrusa]|uniref:Uncharacterized protein n=1 Tax=Caerostris extrusa TaxID=172846 RepID=A0AAV4NFU3_CAEEX|nr:uncharacterized protein CEXT_770691 [Caerostris extrusa]
MCLTKLAINICKQQEIGSLIQRMPFLQTLEERERYRETFGWKRIEQLSVDIISDLSIPEKFKFRIFHAIWPICMEINLVTRHYFKFLFCGPPLTDIDLQNKLEWTSYGTAHLVRTAKVFIRDEVLNVNERYRLACYYCLEDDIPEIWAKVVENYDASLDFESQPRSLWLDQMTLYWAAMRKRNQSAQICFHTKTSSFMLLIIV